jgi:hypothetical protein
MAHTAQSPRALADHTMKCDRDGSHRGLLESTSLNLSTSALNAA